MSSLDQAVQTQINGIQKKRQDFDELAAIAKKAD
jgi:hypothetical protein